MQVLATDFETCSTEIDDQLFDLQEKVLKNNSSMRKKLAIENIKYKYTKIENTNKIRVDIVIKSESAEKKLASNIASFFKEYLGLNYPTQNFFYVEMKDKCEFYIPNKYLSKCVGQANADGVFTRFSQFGELAKYSVYAYLNEAFSNVGQSCEIKLSNSIFNDKELFDSSQLNFEANGKNYPFITQRHGDENIINLSSAPSPIKIKYKDFEKEISLGKCVENNDLIAIDTYSSDSHSFCSLIKVSKGKIEDPLKDQSFKIESINEGEGSVFDRSKLQCQSPLGGRRISKKKITYKGIEETLNCENNDFLSRPKISSLSDFGSCKFEVQGLSDYFDISSITEDGKESENCNIGELSCSLASPLNEKEKEFRLVVTSKFSDAIRMEHSCLSKAVAPFDIKNYSEEQKNKCKIPDDKLSEDQKKEEYPLNDEVKACLVSAKKEQDELDAKKPKHDYILEIQKLVDTSEKKCLIIVKKGKVKLKESEYSLDFDAENMTCSGRYCKSKQMKKKNSAKVTAKIKDSDIELVNDTKCSFKSMNIKKEDTAKKSNESSSSSSKSKNSIPYLPDLPPNIPISNSPALIEW